MNAATKKKDAGITLLLLLRERVPRCLSVERLGGSEFTLT
jgi:hypothetical protein